MLLTQGKEYKIEKVGALTMDVQGFFSFIIRGDDLDFDNTTANMKIQPSEVKRKGDPTSTRIKAIMKDDMWEYTVNYNGYDELHIELETFLNDLQPSKEFIRELSKVHDVYIFFSFCSDYGQMGFELQPKVIQALAELNIRFEVHILSFGMVEK